MPSTPARLAAGLLTGGLGLAALTGCTITSNNVSCSTSSCSVTLSGEGSEAEIFNTSLSYDGTADGRASVSVGDNTASCVEGESVSAGPLRLECTEVSEDSVTLSATLG